MKKRKIKKGKGVFKNPFNTIKNVVQKVKSIPIRSIPSEVKRRINLAREGPRKGPTARFQNFLNKEGNDDIKSVSVGREPVQSGVKKFVNALTFGQLEKARKKLGYDDIYHNYLVVETKDGKKFKVEKNHVVEAKPTNEKGQYNIPLNKNIKLKELINNGIKEEPSRLYKYDPHESNCQVFVDDVIRGNNLLKNVDQKTKNIIEPQDSKQLLQGPFQHIPKVITDIAGTADRVLHGDGLYKAFNKVLKKLTTEESKKRVKYLHKKGYKTKEVRNKKGILVLKKKIKK